MAVYEVKNGKFVAAKVASPYLCAVFVAFTVTLVAVEVVVPVTVNLPPLVLEVNWSVTSQTPLSVPKEWRVLTDRLRHGKKISDIAGAVAVTLSRDMLNI
jgi:hypothetical protein